jgi:hypothetical protein
MLLGSFDHLNYSAIQAFAALGVFAFAFFSPHFWEHRFHAAGALFSRFAARKRTAVVSVFLVAIVARLLLLPWFPVPVPGEAADEFSYLLMGDTFAHAHLAYPPHPLWLSFETFTENFHPTYSSMFFPAQGAILAVGQLLGHPWIGVLLSVALMCATIVWALQGWMTPRWALLGGFFALLNVGLLSYWVNSYWGGAAATIGGALVLGAMPRIRRQQRVRDALLLGIGMAVLANSRPFEGLIFCLPFAVALLLWMRRSYSPPARIALRKLVTPVIAVMLPTVAFIAYYDWRLTGNPLLTPHELYTQTYLTSPIFFWDHQKPLLHYNNPQIEELFSVFLPSYYRASWADLWKLSINKISLYRKVFLWAGAVPILMCVPLLLRDQKGRWLLAVAVLSLVGLFAVTSPLPHYAAPVLCVFYAVLVQALRHLRLLHFRGRWIGLGIARAAVVLLLFQTATAIPERLRHPDDWLGGFGLQGRAEVVNKLSHMPGKHLIIVRYGPEHDVNFDWVYNDADIDGSKVVWARDMGAEQNAKLLDYYRDRQVWRLTVDRDTEYSLEYNPSDDGKAVPQANH